MDVNVEEKRTVVFEPGVTKTLFDSNWAGEVGSIVLRSARCRERLTFWAREVPVPTTRTGAGGSKELASRLFAVGGGGGGGVGVGVGGVTDSVVAVLFVSSSEVRKIYTSVATRHAVQKVFADKLHTHIYIYLCI